jgi:formylglycine-generating enzyme required for sulfatase activity
MTGGVLNILKRGLGWLAGLLAIVLLWLAPAAAQTPERRVALLIGNAAYSEQVGQLNNPVNDVNALRDTLIGLGFKREDVVVVTNANRFQMLSAIGRFRTTLAGLSPGDVAFFYFSGHGAQPAGREGRLNLIPVGTSAPTDEAFWFDTLAFETDVLSTFEAARTNAVLILAVDACRNELRLPNRSLGGGDKGFGVVPAASGMLIAFAADQGQSAKDQPSASGVRTDLSPYAQALIEGLQMPGQAISAVFTGLRPRVVNLTGGAQEPTVQIKLNRDPVLRPGAVGPGPLPVDVCEGARRDWDVVRASSGTEALAAFERAHAGCVVYASLAREERVRRQNASLPQPGGDDFLNALRESQVDPKVLDARVTPSTTRAPVIFVNPATLPDFALFRECEDCPEMVVLPGGSFQMGSPSTEAGRNADEGPQKWVNVGRFAMSRFETTWAEWDACVTAGRCISGRSDHSWGKGRRPVINVDWVDARIFAGFVSGRTSGVYRLPSEAEWEYAARGGTSTRWSIGDSDGQLGTYAWLRSNSGGRTQPVGGRTANPWGLFDVHGNVLEWVQDCYVNSYSGASPNGAASTIAGCASRVIRGGSWDGIPLSLRSAHRSWIDSSTRRYYLGFRLSRSL